MNSDQTHQLIPSMCIALDDSSERILASIRGFHFRRNEQLIAISEFLRFSLSNPEFFSEITSATHGMNSTSPSSRSEVFGALVNEVEKVKQSLKVKINQMLEHKKLIDAGIESQQVTPFNIFLLADGKDTTGGGLLLPILVLITGIIKRLDAVNLHILLNGAYFPDLDTKNDDDLQVYTLLQELRELSNSDSELFRMICENLKTEAPAFIPATLYLFHNKKQGPGEITENKTMEGMIGNSLLHLLSDNLAEENARISPSSELTLPITGIGSVLVSYDPEALQNYCALKKSAEIIDTIFLGEGLEGEASMLASQVKALLGNAETWTKELFRTPPEAVSQVIFEPETNEYKVVLKEIKFAKIRYLAFQSLNWLDVIEDSEKGIIRNIVAASETTIVTNIDRLSQNWDEKIKAFAISLPQRSNLYPGGIDSSRKALAALKKLLLSEIKTITYEHKVLEKSRNKPLEQLQKIQKRIHRIIQHIPDLPKFIAKIPEKYQELAAGLYYHYAYLLPIIRLRVLKKRYLDLVAQITGIDIQLIAGDKLQNAVDHVCGEDGILNKWLREVNRLEEYIEALRTELLVKIDTTSFNSEEGWMEYFRVSMVDAQIAGKIYDDHHRDADYISTELITNSMLFQDWQLDFEPISRRLSTFAHTLFQDVWALDLQDVHRIYSDLKIPENSPLSGANFRRLFNISQPLLKPNFDIMADHGASPAKYYLKGNSEWEDFNIPLDISQNGNWEVVWTDDPYNLLVSQAVHNVDFRLIDNLFIEQQRKFQSLSEKEKNLLSTLSHRDYVTTISENDEEIVREYRWHFSPKGSHRTYSYSLRLAIDVARYKKYASEERVRTIEEYKIYAQTDMPEINQLVLEFQKIFASVNWSTFNKAFCVLKFVQNAITYQYDKDSKKQSEWPRYPIETLAESVGDCEDVAILSAAVLVRLGFEVVLLHYEGHMAFGVCGSPDMSGDYVCDKNTGKKYYYGEATADGWVLGEIPKETRKDPIDIIKVELLVKEEDSTE